MELNFIYDNKRYIQRTPMSVINEYDLNGKLLNKYEQVPKDVQEEIETLKNMQESPNDFFECSIRNNEVTICSTNVMMENIIIPETIKGFPVTKIDRRAFLNAKSARTIMMPDTITRIGAECFMNTDKLIDIHLSTSIKDIPKWAFHHSGVKNINLENIENIDEYAFSDSQIKEINLEKCKQIGFSAFIKCDNLKKVDLKNVEELEKSIFSECKNLKEIIFPNNLEIIPRYICYSCPKLKSVTLPEKLLEIDYAAFYYCGSLEKITFPDSLDKIGRYAFSNCDNLTNILLNPKTEYLEDTFDFDKKLLIKFTDTKENIDLEIER